MEYNYLTYVKEYFKNNHFTYYNYLRRNEIDALEYTISEQVRRKYKDFKSVFNGRADKFISQIIDIYVNKERKDLRINSINLKNYVNKYLNANYFINYSIKTLDAIVDRVSAMLMATYDYNKVMNGNIDEEIDVCYNEILEGLREEIHNYTIKYINNNIIPLTDIDNVEVADDVVKLILTNNKFNAVDLFLGKYEKLINEMVYVNRKKNSKKRMENSPDTINYIKELIHIDTNNNDLLSRVIDKVDMDLRDKGLTPFDIISGNYDADIKLMGNNYYFKELGMFVRDNSIKKDGVPVMILSDIKKKNMLEQVSKVIVSATLISFFITGGYGLGKGMTIYTNTFKATTDNIIQSYDQYKKFDDFKYLAFYRAYNSVGEDKLFVMDNMIDEIEKKIVNNSSYDDLKKELRTNSCYLDFIYDRLFEMGYEEIKEEKYFDLLSAYLDARREHRYENPVKYLTDREERLLNKVISKYEELSEQYLIELGVLLGNKDNIEEVSTSTRGR